MKAIHCWWAKPALHKYSNINKYTVDDKSVLHLILSALYWKKYNGNIELYTDSITLKYFKKIGLDKLYIWDYINTEIHDSIPEQVNPRMYWAGNKFYVYRHMSAPFVSLDVDAYFTKTVDWPSDIDLFYAHREQCIYPHYPNPAVLLNDTKLLKKFPWKSNAINASMLLFNSKKLLKEYTETAINYIEKEEHNIKSTFTNFGNNILVIEQRLLAEIVDNKKYTSRPMITDLFYNYEYKKTTFIAPEDGSSNAKDVVQYFNHIWGEKYKTTVEYSAYIKYLETYLGYIKNDFPDMYDDIIKVLLHAYKLTHPLKLSYTL